ncbi:unnamed protein product [Cylindrotheca closterium]|uniref:Uncharacterized protein n=1 Tax=Cylindrotheca closterium TaxID=2856 RepID=A0AAD2G8K5_9STRA|nr:unnamed protein product [Cylindrotheca closterium]
MFANSTLSIRDCELRPKGLKSQRAQILEMTGSKESRNASYGKWRSFFFLFDQDYSSFCLFPQILLEQKIIMTFDFLIEQNNRTLAFLKAQDFIGAIDSSSLALKYHKARQAALHDQSPLHHSCSGSDCLDQCMFLSKINGSAPHSDHADHIPFVYDRGIVVPRSMHDPSVVTSILIFNTALAHHLAAEAAYGTTSPELWHKARRFYELAYQSHDMDYNVLFQIVLINNLAMIEQKMGNMSKSISCLEYLTAVLMILVDRGCSLHLHHAQGCLANIPSLASKTASAA